MFAVDPSYAAMSVAHVFAKTNVSDRDDFGAFRFNCAQGFLNHAVFGVSATRLFVFLPGNTKKENRLETGVLRLPRLIDNFIDGELKNARHARDGAAFVDLFADEKRENEIVSGQIRFANEISERRRTPQAPRAMNQFSHATRVRAAAERSKAEVRSRKSEVRSRKSRLPTVTDRRYSVGNGAGGELSLNRYKQFVHEAGVCDAATNFQAEANRNAEIHERDASADC